MHFAVMTITAESGKAERWKMKKEYRKPKLISAAEVDEIRKKVEQQKAIRRFLKRDGMTDEEIDEFFKSAVEDVDWI